MTRSEAIKAGMAKSQAQIQADVLDAVRLCDPATVATVTQRSGYSEACVRFRLARLVEEGAVTKVLARRVRGRTAPFVYRVVQA